MADYKQILEINPNHAEARLHLAALLVERALPNEALRHFQRLQQRLGHSPEVQLGVAQCRLQLGELAEARKLLDALLAEQPRYVGALSQRGRLALQEGKPAEAEALLRKAALEPNDWQVLYGLVQCLRLQGKEKEAKELGLHLKRVREDRSRLGEVMEAVQKDPQDPAPRLEAGNILLRLGKASEGLHRLRTALLEDPHHRPTHQALADYYERAGNRELAARHRRLARQEEKQKEP
jgi:predicted Zn-dependent protease